MLREYVMNTQHILSLLGEYILIHIIYSLHLHNEGTHTHIDAIIEEHMSRICYEPP
jgi:hypothetical protein